MEQIDPRIKGAENVAEYLGQQLGVPSDQITISLLQGGYSNLTYLVKVDREKSYILRRPPLGMKITKAHDMAREYRLLKALENAKFKKIPKPVLCCEDESVWGSPFFLMEKVTGTILRNKVPEGKEFNAEYFHRLSVKATDGLLELHRIDLVSTGLEKLGAPENYVSRQITGWSERYQKSKTEHIEAMELISNWLNSNIPTDKASALIHNDFKYDNLVLKNGEPEILAILDWEMATIGDPLMDLGTTLAYWAEARDEPILQQFNLSHIPGNMDRSEVIAYYGSHSHIKLDKILFYYVFGVFKVAVIAQQIFKRYSMGDAPDPRFGALIEVVKACSRKALKSIDTQKI